jgi:hypothetical protein
MILPDRLTANWIATLGDSQLMEIELHLHGQFATEETHEKRRRGDRYAMLEGPEALVTAWHRWLMANNEARTRGLVIRHRK